MPIPYYPKTHQHSAPQPPVRSCKAIPSDGQDKVRPKPSTNPNNAPDLRQSRNKSINQLKQTAIK